MAKKNLHPQYYPKAEVRCACGNTFTVGSTKPQLEVEVCSACHPAYTGEKRFIDAAGQVEKFRARLQKTKQKQQTNSNKNDATTGASKEKATPAGKV